MSNMDAAGAAILILAGLWGFLSLLGSTFDTKKCTYCRFYGPREYMNPVELENGKKRYAHQGCKTNN
jgi:hypothetical protein